MRLRFLRGGEHETTAGGVANFIAFFGSTLGRRPRARSETWIHGYAFDGWRRLSGESISLLSFLLRAFRAPGCRLSIEVARDGLREHYAVLVLDVCGVQLDPKP